LPQPLTPQQRVIRASLAAHEMHATNDPVKTTQAGRDAFLQTFYDQVDEHEPGLPDAERQRRAEHLRRAHMKRLALASSRARARAKESP
jgi:hypothetical protein